MPRKAVYTAFAAALALLFVAGLAFAKAKQVNIEYPAKLADGPELKAGSYKVDVLNPQNNPEAVFYRGKEVVAKAPVKLVDEPRKSEYTAVSYTTEQTPRVITEIFLGGSKQKLVFENPKTKTN
jgi:hypothetical protein